LVYVCFKIWVYKKCLQVLKLFGNPLMNFLSSIHCTNSCLHFWWLYWTSLHWIGCHWKIPCFVHLHYHHLHTDRESYTYILYVGGWKKKVEHESFWCVGEKFEWGSGWHGNCLSNSALLIALLYLWTRLWQCLCRFSAHLLVAREWNCIAIATAIET